MPTLLKDLPECMEKIENSNSLMNDLREVFLDASFAFEMDEDNTVSGRIDNPTELAISIVEKITDFVNQNYEWKGVKK